MHAAARIHGSRMQKQAAVPCASSGDCPAQTQSYIAGEPLLRMRVVTISKKKVMSGSDGWESSKGSDHTTSGVDRSH